ncbi:hypothetical protein H5410_005887 [Solanum commersonii]|uniref:Uncharacterized protein n=1 Tax=Solanum commersonii TaxID=4109 RepID=A0A9J6A7U6_SOLCO|nr:hypothetical protein H5410_005887 [Solanum commersonii]
MVSSTSLSTQTSSATSMAAIPIAPLIPNSADMVSMASSMEVIHVENLLLPWRMELRLLIMFFNNGSNLTPLFCHGYKLQSLKRYFRLLFVLIAVLLLMRRGYRLNKGSLSISDYVHRLKSIADALISIGNPISDSDLVLQVQCAKE